MRAPRDRVCATDGADRGRLEAYGDMAAHDWDRALGLGAWTALEELADGLGITLAVKTQGHGDRSITSRSSIRNHHALRPRDSSTQPTGIARSASEFVIEVPPGACMSGVTREGLVSFACRFSWGLQ